MSLFSFNISFLDDGHTVLCNSDFSNLQRETKKLARETGGKIAVYLVRQIRQDKRLLVRVISKIETSEFRCILIQFR